MEPGFEELLRRIALHDEAALDAVLRTPLRSEPQLLDAKTAALVRLAGLLGVQSGESTLCWAASVASAAGAADGEIVDVLLALAPLIGAARTVSSATGVALGLGYDVDAALEDPRR